MATAPASYVGAALVVFLSVELGGPSQLHAPAAGGLLEGAYLFGVVAPGTAAGTVQSPVLGELTRGRRVVARQEG